MSHHTIFALTHFIWSCDFLFWLGSNQCQYYWDVLWCQALLQLSRFHSDVVNVVKTPCTGHVEGLVRAHHLQSSLLWTERVLTGCNMHHRWDWAESAWFTHHRLYMPACPPASDPFLKTKSVPCPRKCRQPCLNRNLLLEPNSAEGRVHEGLDLHSLIRQFG